MHFLRRLVPSLALIVVLSCFANAQEFQWNNVQGVSSGERIKITLADGKSHTGEFQSATDATVVISSKHGSESYARENVRHVWVRRAGHRGRNALIGAGIGAGVGLGAGASIDNGCTSTSIICTGNKGKAILTPAFGVLGAGIGALLPSGGWREIYLGK